MTDDSPEGGAARNHTDDDAAHNINTMRLIGAQAAQLIVANAQHNKLCLECTLATAIDCIAAGIFDGLQFMIKNDAPQEAISGQRESMKNVAQALDTISAQLKLRAEEGGSSYVN